MLEDAQVTAFEDVKDQLSTRAGPTFATWMRTFIGGVRRGQPAVRRAGPSDAAGPSASQHATPAVAVAHGVRASRRRRSDRPHVPEARSRRPARADVLDLIRVQARLRAEDGCPWDREQTHATLGRHLLEETHELLEAIDAEDDDAIRDELGDLLLQVTFHAQIAAEEGRWDVDDVAAGLVAKLVHRHPHVFGDAEVDDAGEVLVNWERLKAEETGGRRGDDIPATLPALARAAKVQRRAAGWGFAWPSPSAPSRRPGRSSTSSPPPTTTTRRKSSAMSSWRWSPSRGSWAGLRDRAPAHDPRVRRAVRTVRWGSRRNAGWMSTPCPRTRSGRCSGRCDDGELVGETTIVERGDIEAARRRIAGHVRSTPVLEAGRARSAWRCRSSSSSS